MDELREIIEEYLNEKGLWYDFKEFIEKRGHTLDEFGFEEE